MRQLPFTLLLLIFLVSVIASPVLAEHKGHRNGIFRYSIIRLLEEGRCLPIVKAEAYYCMLENKPQFVLNVQTNIGTSHVAIPEHFIVMDTGGRILPVPACLISGLNMNSIWSVIFVRTESDVKKYNAAIESAIKKYYEETEKSTELPFPEYTGQLKPK